jgi:two-component system chemotaxis response regulator CheY
MAEAAAPPILLVDDYRTIRRIVATLLARSGFTDIDEAADGAEALAKMRQRRYALVISDWNMQPMGGLDLLREVRADPELGATPFVMLTAEGRTENAVAAREAGASAYLMKPFDVTALRSKLDGLLAAA